MKNYKNRIVDKILEKKLKGKGAVLIQGPKWCGKTTTAEQISKSILYMAKSDEKEQNLTMADVNPSLLLKGETPRLIDEWQIAPKLWDAVRYEIDHRNSEGQFILTGSSVPAKMDDVTHSGTGRFAWLLMRPMSLFESGESNGQVSLKDLFDGTKKIEGINELELEKIAYLVCRGGWPRAIFMEEDIALEQAYDYYDAIVNRDISEADGISRNPERVKNLMKSYARNIGTQASSDTLKKDMLANDSTSLDTDTVLAYINALKKIFVVEESPAWNPNLRSKTAIRTSDTRYFIDPSIATASLGIGPKDLINDLNTFGLLFETLCIRDLRVYAESINGNVYHYRDANDLECDAVIHLRDGKYGLIEIKLGGDKLIDEGVENLKKLEASIDVSKMNNPSFLLILTAIGQYAYRREDGVYVVPIGCLKN
jgi:predicted AAA+ superfamily ATPase